MNRPPNTTLALKRNAVVVAALAAAFGTLAAAVLLFVPAALAAPSKAATVSTANNSLGRILVNSSGRTLYLFQKDRNGKSACSGQCASFWPPLIANGKPRVAGGAKASLIGTTKRSDGRLQVTYNHHPLYTFAEDKKAGQTKGEGFHAFGANWYVLSPGGSKIDND